jgi:sporulation protein YlmC with PRC-barrel domain
MDGVEIRTVAPGLSGARVRPGSALAPPGGCQALTVRKPSDPIPAKEERRMLVPFGTHVVDREGKSVGTVSRLVLHPQSRKVVGLVVQQGVVDRREVVVPLDRIAAFDREVHLALSAAELAGLELLNSQNLVEGKNLIFEHQRGCQAREADEKNPRREPCNPLHRLFLLVRRIRSVKVAPC